MVMTWRNLIDKLAKLDDTALDLPIYVCLNNEGDLDTVSSLDPWYFTYFDPQPAIDEDNVLFLDLTSNKEELSMDKLNTVTALNEVETLIDWAGDVAEWQDKEKEPAYYKPGKGYKVDDVYKRLSIFDWWNDHLSVSQLKDMRTFLREALKLGFTGYVCFKVGATGCANGMWAYVNQTEDGFSPDGPFIYKSFTPEYSEWSAYDGRGNKLDMPTFKTIRELENYIIDMRMGED